MPVPFVKAIAEAMAEFNVLGRLVMLSIAEEPVSERDMIRY
jgi:hypothetical protein